jgi:hypothetical protein
VLIFLLVFAGFINAGSMSESVQRWEQALQQTLGRSSFHIILFVSFLIALVALPVILVAGSVWLGKLFSRRPMSWRESVSTFAQAFVPLGFSMWLAHFSYHLVNGALTAVPVVQRAARSAGLSILGKPDWSLSASMINFDWLPSAQLLMLGLGLLFTLYIGWRLAVQLSSQVRSDAGNGSALGSSCSRTLRGGSLDHFSADADARHDDGWNR